MTVSLDTTANESIMNSYRASWGVFCTLPWLHPPYPPGYELPGIGYCLVIGGMVFCFMGFILYKVFTAPPEALAELRKRFQSAEEQDAEEEHTESVNQIVRKSD